jgi:adenylate kinase family enzyme
MTETPKEKRKLILITGIPASGKTTYGNAFATQFGFVHYDLEDEEIRNRFSTGPAQFIDSILQTKRNVVVTWGFFPDAHQVGLVKQFEAKGFQLIWFDGNRPAALRKFIDRGYPIEALFHLQIGRIEVSKVIERIAPTIINPFDDNGQFRDAAVILREIEKGT